MSTKKKTQSTLLTCFMEEVRASARAGLARIRREHPRERIYGFSIMVHPLGGLVAGAVGTDATLRKAVNPYVKLGYSARNGRTREMLAANLRWQCTDGWHLLLPEFQPIEDTVREIHGSSTADDPLPASRAIHLACATVLAELDLLGVFGRGARRERIVLNLFWPDSSDADKLQWAGKLNPHEAFARLKNDIGSLAEVRQLLRS